MIYDCFMFFNENDLLEIRINQHWNYVDKFFILEAGETHSGLKKPFNFDHQRFEKYRSKIVYKTIESFSIINHAENAFFVDRDFLSTKHDNQKDTNTWLRESFQRNYILKYLAEYSINDDDIVMFMDLDEICSSGLLASLPSLFDGKSRVCTSDITKQLINADPIIGIECHHLIYKLNLLKGKIHAGPITTFRNTCRIKPSTIRSFAIFSSKIKNSGWHFSFLDSESGSKVLEKYKSWGHSNQTDLEKKYCDLENAQEALSRLERDFKISQCSTLEDLELPKWLINNKDKYLNFFKQ